jgi:hypothetical protein
MAKIRDFPFFCTSDRLWALDNNSYPMGPEAPSPRTEKIGVWSNHSSHLGLKIRMCGATYVLMTCFSRKHRNKCKVFSGSRINSCVQTSWWKDERSELNYSCAEMDGRSELHKIPIRLYTRDWRNGWRHFNGILCWAVVLNLPTRSNSGSKKR